MRTLWQRPAPWLRRGLGFGLKATVSVGAVFLLLTHQTQDAHGARLSVWDAVVDQLQRVEFATMLPFLVAAAAIKAIGILCSMLRWHLLLIGQRIRFNFGHIVGSFLIGRFLGTFLPSTVGLDSYKLYDAARFSKRVAEPAAATVVEKVMGLAGIFLTFLLTFPLGAAVLGDAAARVGGVAIPVAACVVGGAFLALWHPDAVATLLRRLPAAPGRRLAAAVTRVGAAAAAYRGRGRLLAAVLGLSFLVHFCTAAMYFLTVLAIGAEGAGFWEVCFASSIQILATVLSPFTIAGEGVREVVQALLLGRHLGMSASVLSAALGFWAAEAMTLVGVVFWWQRAASYHPRRVDVGDDDASGGASHLAAG